MHYFKHFLLAGSLVFSANALAHTYSGELDVLVFDNFIKNQAKTVYQLHENNDVYVLELPAGIDKSKLLTGAEVIIEGQETKGLKEKTIKVESLTVKQNTSLETPTVDTRRVLALLVNFTNIKATETINEANVDTILYTSSRSTNKNFQLSSFSQVNFIRDTNNDGKADIYTVNLNYESQDCNYSKWAADAKSAAANAGINLSLYRHFMFVIPQNVNCTWGGLGNLGCGTSCNTWVRAYNPAQVYSQLVYTHELGHNMGMSHAATDLNNDGTTDSEYGDAACTMGTGDFQYYKEVNAPHRDQMHWFDSFANRIKLVQSDGQFTLYPLESGANVNGLLVLKLKKNATETYYVSYRKNKGVFGAGAPAYLDKVNIHRTRTGDAHSYFIKALNNNESFVDAANNVKITVVSAGGETAVVNVGNSPSQPTLTSCIYNGKSMSMTCTAQNGGLLSLGAPSGIYRKYTGSACKFNGQIFNDPGTLTLSDTQYVTATNLSPSIIGCALALCNNSSCTDLKTTETVITSVNVAR